MGKNGAQCSFTLTVQSASLNAQITKPQKMQSALIFAGTIELYRMRHKPPRKEKTTMTTQTFDALYNKGYRPRLFSSLKRGGKVDPVGVMLLEKKGDFFESIIYERFGTWLYATPEKLVR